MFGISLATLRRYIKQRREEGHVRPKAIPGRPSKKRAQVEASVLPQLQVHDDALSGQRNAMKSSGQHGERMRAKFRQKTWSLLMKLAPILP
jgi:transposase